MADMGFMPAVRRILDRTSPERQTLLFSATLDGDIAVLSRDYQRDPVRHEAGTVEPETIDARHHFWMVQHHDRVQHTADLVGEAGRSIVFTRTRRGADRLAKQLSNHNIGAVAMHGGRSQGQRNRALKDFSSGRAQALIATDVAARGIHIDAVESVIHYDPPADHKDYLHRSGRTARAGAAGTVVSLVTGAHKRAVQQMLRNLNLQAPIESPRLEAIRRGGHRLGDSVPHGRDARDPAPGRKPGNLTRQSLYVANLPWKATAEDLAELFGTYGEVHDAAIIANRRTGRSRGFGFVDMPRPAAVTAMEALHGSKMDGRDLTVRTARPRSRLS
jgi:superfamily II DNA/RNA helicase